MSQSRSSAKAQILEAATRLMRVRGYHRTALEDVLRESGAGKGNFYHHFHSKEELGYAILDRLVRVFTERMLDPIFRDPSRTPLEQVDAFFDAILAAQRAQNCVGGCPMGNLAAELADLHEGFRRRLAAVFDLWHGRLEAVLARAQAGGALATDADPDDLARFLVASLEGAMLLTKVQKDIRVMETCLAALRRHLGLYQGTPEPVEVHG